MYFPLLVGVMRLSLFKFCNHLKEEEKFKAGCFAFIVFRCFANVNVLWLFLMVPWVGLQCLIVVFPDYTRLLLQ